MINETAPALCRGGAGLGWKRYALTGGREVVDFFPISIGRPGDKEATTTFLFYEEDEWRAIRGPELLLQQMAEPKLTIFR